MIFLSLGAGVQSSVMLMLAIRGEIERPDHVIWADTGFEPRAVYKHVDWCERQCQKAGLPFHRVKALNNMREQFDLFESGDMRSYNAHPPFFVRNAKSYTYKRDGVDYQVKAGEGMLHRQCTREAKIVPLERKQLELMGYTTARGVQDGAAVVQIGISTDEARRAGPSPKRWVDRSYPLIDPMKMSRADCQSWWEQNYSFQSLPSSACIICPYKSTKMWAQMKATAPDDFADAVALDDRFRAAYKRLTGQNIYLVNQCKPLADVDLGEKQGSMDLDDAVYCAGGCGL